MKKYSPTIGFFAVLFLVFIFEGLGIREGRIISRFILYLAPMVLFGIDFLNKKQIVIPVRLTIFFTLFLIGVSLSTFHAANIQSAFDHQLYYISLILLSIYVINHSNEIKQYIPHFFVLCSGILFIYALFINFFLPKAWSELIPITGFQFVYGSKELLSHHPIGAFLLIPLTYFYITVRQKPTLIAVLFTGGLIIAVFFSFLRASYMALLAIVVIDAFFVFRKKKEISLIHKSIVVITILTVFISFLSITAFPAKIPVFSKINEQLRSNIPMLSHKSEDNSRMEFFSQAFRTIENNPLMGIGSYNFYYASQKQASSYDQITGTSHNILIDIWVENGFVALIIFLSIIVLVFHNTQTKGFSERDYRLLLNFIALLVLFQFSHYHKMYFMLSLFFSVFSLVYKEKQNYADSRLWLLKGSIMIAIISIMLISSYVLNKKGQYSDSVKIYPIALEPNLRVLYKYRDANNLTAADLQAEKISYLYPEEPDVLDIVGDYYRDTNRDVLALSYYSSALSLSPHDLSFLKNTYNEMLVLYGKHQADIFMQHHFSEHQTKANNPPYTDTIWFYDWCKGNNVPCDY